jgi:translation initiation factor IF-2
VSHFKHHYKGKQTSKRPSAQTSPARDSYPENRLDLVVKSDLSGSLEAVTRGISELGPEPAAITIIHSGIGPVTKTDIFTAETGSRLVLGLNVGVLPHIEPLCKEHGVEVRLYAVIYRLFEDLRTITANLSTLEPAERITGSARVTALFKGPRKGIILGCEVTGGFLRSGSRFRLISAMGPVYKGIIESLRIEKETVTRAGVGQKAGLKISDFNKAKIGDMVECYEISRPPAGRQWRPEGGVLRF